MANNMFDAVMQRVGGKEWNYDSLAVPQCGLVKAEDIEEPICLQQFLAEACRRTEGTKVTTVIFDVHTGVPEFGGFARIGEQVQRGELDGLPLPLQVPHTLPKGARMGLVIENLHDGTLNIVKVLHFPDKLAIAHALKLCTGDAYVPVYRPGPWAVRKTAQYLLQRLPGYRVLWNNVSEKTSSIRKSQSAQWAPEDEALRLGIEFINAYSPEGDALNEQTFWILSSIREGSGTPIDGWPEAKVRFMCQNKSRGLGGAQPQYDFPLHTYSLKGFLSEFLLPLVYPLMVVHGVMMIGWPGVGKTPALIAMILAIGRYHIGRLGLNEKPSWRRSKSLDNFRHRVPQVYDGVFLDDPSREKLDMADLKSYMTAEEDQTCSARYNDVKLVRGQVRAYAANHLSDKDEPSPDGRTTISSDECLQLLRPSFPGEKEADVMAVLKRSLVFIFGKHALYLRLPSQHTDGVVHRINVDDVHLDLLSPHDKYSYAEYKGNMVRGDGYEACIAREQNMIHNSFMNMSEKGTHAYRDHCNQEVQRRLRPRTPSPNRIRHLPSSPSSDEAQSIPPTVPFSVQLATPNMPRKRILTSSTFVYPSPTRRVSTKTAPSTSVKYSPDADHDELPTEPSSSIVAPGADQSSPKACSQSDEMDIDEEASLFLHGVC